MILANNISLNIFLTRVKMIVINNYLNQKNDSSLKRLNKTEYAIMIDIFSIINLVTSSFAIDFQSFLDLLSIFNSLL